MRNKIKSNVNPDDLSDIMNIINDALENTEYEAVAYDNTGIWMKVIIDKKMEFSDDLSEEQT